MGGFVDNGDGTVTDPKTGLMWAAEDNGYGCDITWDDAKKYCESCSTGGYRDWRMPTLNELGSIFRRDLKNEYGYLTTPLIKISNSWVWSGETKGDREAGYLVFDDGIRYWHDRTASSYKRALPVRRGK